MSDAKADYEAFQQSKQCKLLAEKLLAVCTAPIAEKISVVVLMAIDKSIQWSLKKNTKIKKPTTNVFNYISKIIRKMYVMKGGPSLWDSQSWGTQEWSQALLSAAVSSIDFNLCVLCQREISLWHQSLGFLSFLSKQTACSPVLDSGGCANQHRERPD